MPNISKDKRLWGILFLVVILIGGFILIPKRTTKMPKQTGYPVHQQTPLEKQQESELEALVKRLPLTEQGFSLEYNMELYQIVVTLRPPYEQSKNNFDTWLKSSGYEHIVPEAFRFNQTP
jgi:hypothetical protein